MNRIAIFLPLFLFSLLLPDKATATLTRVKVGMGFSGNSTEFTRIYKEQRDRPRQSRTTVYRRPRPTKSQNIVITYEDFVDHLGLDKNRVGRFLGAEEGMPISMDVGSIDTVGTVLQSWTMPNFNDYAFEEVHVEHVSLEASGFQDSFPNLTHAFYVPSLNRYELYELNEDELFLYGYGEFDENNQPYAEDYYLTQSFLPLEWGWEFEGTVSFIYEDDPELDSLQFIQTYYSIGQGTLNTYDEGPVDAIKLYFIEELLEFKDGDTTVYDFYEEMVWYSKQGHYIRACLTDGAPIEGQTDFKYVEYSKIGNSLPVTWENFHAQLNKQQNVELHWTTASEDNNSHFLVQRSTDGKTFSTIGEVKAGAQPLSSQRYTFLDEKAKTGTNYYRIQQVDIDGKTSVTEIVSVLVSDENKDEAVILLYPNPGKNEVFFSQAADYELFDTNGRLLISGRAEGAIDVSGLPKGLYLVRINGGDMHRWMKQ